MERVGEVLIMETPLYRMGKDEEGHDIINFRYAIVAMVEGIPYTHGVEFSRDDLDRAERLVERVRDRGYIDLDHWVQGTPWDYYRIPQTYEEEREEALFNEMWG